MILSVTFSKPTNQTKQILGKDFIKIKISAKKSDGGLSYFVEKFTKTQVFHEHFTEEQVQNFITAHAGKTFKNCVTRTEKEEITTLSNNKGKITTLTKPLNIKLKTGDFFVQSQNKNSRQKKYIISEGEKVPFLILLGVMTDDGKIISSKYDKFRQINRYLEFIDDILDDVIATDCPSAARPLRIADFGCGKSYLTFAVHYFLTEIKKLPCEIEGLDLKQDVIDYCNQTAEKLKLKNITFKTGNIADYCAEKNPDIVITLHACDTATDYALKYAVESNAKAILSVPCCQHQINSQISQNQKKSDFEMPQDFEPLLKWGIIKEKFSSLVTDALRGQWLEQMGYKVQMLEFIDMEHTPKNILIRAVKKSGEQEKPAPRILQTLGIKPEIFK